MQLETSEGALPSEEVDNISNTKDAFDEADIQQQIRSSESVNNSSSATSPEVFNSCNAITLNLQLFQFLLFSSADLT